MAHLALEALRLVELIADHSVVLLVDGGSTHNFTQHQLVAQLGLPCWATSPLQVTRYHFWKPCVEPQHLEDKVFLQGS